VEFTYTEWVSVEATNAPCVNGLGDKGRTMITKGVDGVTLKHWSTFRVRTVFSKRERLHRRTITVVSGTVSTDDSHRDPNTGFRVK
jgi:hypothetical protein